MKILEASLITTGTEGEEERKEGLTPFVSSGPHVIVLLKGEVFFSPLSLVVPLLYKHKPYDILQSFKVNVGYSLKIFPNILTENRTSVSQLFLN